MLIIRILSGLASWRVPLALLMMGVSVVRLSAQTQETSIRVVNQFFKPVYSFRGEIRVVDKPVLYENGILFTYYGNPNDEVFLSGDFNEWREKIPMHKSSEGIFYYFLTSALKKGDYTYRFQVNGEWINDQEQPFFKLDIYNQRVSYFRLPRNIIFTVANSPELLPDGKYRFYLKDQGYREVSLVTDANFWEPGFTPMRLENGYWFVDYYWGKKKLLYTFWVDGEKMFDPNNLSKTLTDFNLPVNYFIPALPPGQ